MLGVQTAEEARLNGETRLGRCHEHDVAVGLKLGQLHALCKMVAHLLGEELLGGRLVLEEHDILVVGCLEERLVYGLLVLVAAVLLLLGNILLHVLTHVVHGDSAHAVQLLVKLYELADHGGGAGNEIFGREVEVLDFQGYGVALDKVVEGEHAIGNALHKVAACLAHLDVFPQLQGVVAIGKT